MPRPLCLKKSSRRVSVVQDVAEWGLQVQKQTQATSRTVFHGVFCQPQRGDSRELVTAFQTSNMGHRMARRQGVVGCCAVRSPPFDFLGQGYS